MGVDHLDNLAARLRALSLEVDDVFDFVQPQPERLCPPDEAQHVQVAASKGPISRVGSFGRGDQALAFVEPDRFLCQTSLLGRFTYRDHWHLVHAHILALDLDPRARF